MNQLLARAFEELSKLPDDRQTELAHRLMEIAESDRILAVGELSLTPEQWAEVDAAMSEDAPYASHEEVEAFFAQCRDRRSGTSCRAPASPRHQSVHCSG